MLLAGDLGGTKTLLGLYERGGRRPAPVAVREYATLEYDGLGAMMVDFLAQTSHDAAGVEAACVGVAGPVRAQEADLTNVPWHVNAAEVSDHAGIGRITLLNDVEAMTYAIDALDAHERVVLHAGEGTARGNAALLAVGTGVGMAVLHYVGDTMVPVPSEGGHADFAARTERYIALLRSLRPRHGRVDIERVLAGPGLANIARFTHGGACPRFPDALVAADEPAQVTKAALDGSCPSCREAMDMYTEGLGAAAGNLALMAKATGGIYLGGGVPAKILPALQSPRFLDAFFAKAPVDALVASIPVSVITLPEVGLLGAAVAAGQMR